MAISPTKRSHNAAGKLRQLSWGSNSELLAVVLSEPESESESTTGGQQAPAEVVQIWHRSNWHWYLKQEQVYPHAAPVSVAWDEAVPLRLHVCSAAAWYRQVPCCADTIDTTCTLDYMYCNLNMCGQICIMPSL